MVGLNQAIKMNELALLGLRISSLPFRRHGRTRLSTCVTSILATLLVASVRVNAQCADVWADGFGLPGILDVSGSTYVSALHVFDDGTGPALYVAGFFDLTPGVLVHHIAKWTGSGYEALSSGLNDDGNVMAVFDDGTGPALYVGGNFTTAGGIAADGIAKWDGISWSFLGSGLQGNVHALAVFDDDGIGPNAPALFAGGLFTTAGGTTVNYISKWNGSNWSALGTGLSSAANALAVYDDGSGPALFVGGGFTTAGGITVNRLAKWNGSTWSTVGTTPGVSSTVEALTTFDDGTGTALYVGGNFQNAGGIAAADRIAKWNGAWSALSTGANNVVETMAVYNDGSAEALFVGGAFTTAGGVSANHIARWDGATWSALGAGVTGSAASYRVYALTTFDDGDGAKLFVGGTFNRVADEAHYYLSAWNGTDWLSVPSTALGLNSIGYALTEFDDGNGPTLIAAGNFDSAGTTVAANIAKFDGASWSHLGSGLNSNAYALSVFDDDGVGPSPPDLYVGGSFTTAGGFTVNRIAKWDGANWFNIGGVPNGQVNALTVFNDGSGDALYVGGSFTDGGGNPSADRIAKWNGTTWSALGAGLNNEVWSLFVYDEDGSGLNPPALFVGGEFTDAGGNANADRIARWDGSSWASLGLGATNTVYALASFNDGSGDALYAGGSFGSIGGLAISFLAKWSNSTWTSVGGGVAGTVYALAPFGSGPDAAMYVGGNLSSAGGAPASGIAKWTGTSWFPIGDGVDDDVRAFYPFDDGNGLALFSAGMFTQAGGKDAARIAKLTCTFTDCNKNGIDDSVDIGAGTSEDCNNNDVPDECDGADCNLNDVLDVCDIAVGTSRDCNGNGVPEECELVDCNLNAISDSCDVLDATSLDCDTNGRPDECDTCLFPPVGGTVFLSGDDADDVGHCFGTGCGGLYPAIFSFAVDNSASPGSGILALGINGGQALASLNSWNAAANGGPDVPITVLTNPLDIQTVKLADYDVVYVPSSGIHTHGGFTSMQLSAINTRQAAMADFVNVFGGSLIALTQADEPEAYGWLPIPVLTQDRTHVSVCPTTNLTSALSPGSTCQNMSHCCYHTVFTGPPGFLGLSALAESTGNPAGDVILLGGTAQGLCTPDCNSNGVPDECELASGDCNGNQYLDACESTEDCNKNSLPDVCDIGSGSSDDCDGDSIPDECQTDCNQNDINDVCELLHHESDDCGSALLVCPGLVVHAATNEASNDGSSSCENTPGGGDVWYKYVPSASGTLSLSLCGSMFDTVLSIHSNCPGSGVELACNDNACDLQSGLTIDVTTGTEYFVRVGGNGSSVGAFSLLLDGPSCVERPASDCNVNAVLDECDLANATSLDLNSNGIPDECESTSVPAVSSWGMLNLFLLVLCFGSIVMRSRVNEFSAG